MPLSRTTKIVIGVGAGAAVVVGLLIWRSRRAKARKVAEEAAAAVAASAAQAGLQVPPGANALVKKGVEYINLGKITKYQMEALFQALEKLHISTALIGRITDYFKAKQPSEYRIWEQGRKTQQQQWRGMVKTAESQMAK